MKRTLATNRYPLVICALGLLLGYYPGGQTYVGMALCIIFYLALALLPALIVPKKLKNCL